MAKLSLILVTISLFQISLQNTQNNEIEVEDQNPFAEAAQAIFQNSESPDLAGMLSGFMQGEGGKQMGNMLMGMVQNAGPDTASQIVQGLGSLMNQNAEGGGNTGGFDPAIIGNVLSMLGTPNNQDNDVPNGKEAQGFDLSSAMKFANSFMNQDGSGDVMSALPAIMNLYNTFVGADAQKRADSHANHAWFLPPIVERMHIMLDQFMHSDMGRAMIANIGAEKYIKIFSDDQGNFSYSKFVDMLENHSFRRHWIKMVTGRIAEALSYVADPYTQKKYLTTGQFIANNFLKGQGVPKSGLYDPTRPVESITSLINFVTKKYLNTKFNSKPYVKPAVLYVQDLLKLAETKGYLGRAIDSSEMTHKLTDTINLEMIEPIARVNRAMRFARKTPECTKYVLCLVNQPELSENLSLPGLKSSLSKAASYLASWYISGTSNSPFWSLYNIVQEGKSCKPYYADECHNFHIEEEKVTTEYVHNEL